MTTYPAPNSAASPLVFFEPDGALGVLPLDQLVLELPVLHGLLRNGDLLRQVCDLSSTDTDRDTNRYTGTQSQRDRDRRTDTSRHAMKIWSLTEYWADDARSRSLARRNLITTYCSTPDQITAIYCSMRLRSY